MEAYQYTEDDINKILKLYFSQPQSIYQHLFASFYQFVDEIIPSSLHKNNNYFHENVTSNAIYLHGFKCSNISIKPPVNPNTGELLSPMEARKKQFKYFGTIIADVQQFVEKEDFITGEKTTKNVGNVVEKVPIGAVPIMVKSAFCTTTIKEELMNECKYDPGGYFIVNGMEKVIICIEEMVNNKALVFTKNDDTYEGGCIYTAHINSKRDEWTDSLQILNIKNKKNGDIIISGSQLADIPIFVLFRALGLESDKEIIENITYDLTDTAMINLLRPSLEASKTDKDIDIKTKDDAYNYLITKLKRNRRINSQDEEILYKQKMMYLTKILRKDLLPHLGDDIPKKIRFLGYMINKMLQVMLKRRKPDDRDNYDNKRIDTPGSLLGQLFRQNWRKLLTEIGKNFKKKNQSDENPFNVVNQLKPNIIELGIKTAMSTGVWGVNKSKKGVAQSLSRISWLQVLNELRKVMSPSMDASTSKVISIRMVNPYTYGFLCPIETPQGGNIGIKQSLSMLASISNHNIFQKPLLLDLLNDFNKKYKYYHPFEISPSDLYMYGKIFFNGDWVGVTENIFELYEFLQEKKKDKIIDKHTSIGLDFDEKTLYVYYDGGRMVRPMFQVNNDKLNISKELMTKVNELLKSPDIVKGWNIITSEYKDLISYEDVESSKYIMLAEDIKKLEQNKKNKERKVTYEASKINRYGEYRYVLYTHCDMSKWALFGATVNGVPFSNYNYSNKNIVYFSQGKQSVGMYATNYKDRMDISNVLYYPQLPIVNTEGNNYNNNNNLPSGENTIIAIMAYTGYNQEDSLIMNQSAIDRGLFRSNTLKKYSDEIEKNPSTSQDDVFTKPDRNKVTGMRNANYDKLDENGIVEEETIIYDNDAIIGKISPIQPTGEESKVYSDNSTIYKSIIPGVIDRVHSGIYNSSGYEIRNVRVRMERQPIQGDKFTNRHGQKGTIGLILEQKDMPFTESGIVPDMIMNPHAIPTRMTIAQMIETVAGKLGAIEGKYYDGTPFADHDISKIPEALGKLGYDKYGTEKMYCGITGQEIQADIFIGPVYTCRLKHMILDKIHSRARGPTQAVTRQPLEGRTKNGGLRIGVMENDAMVAHGMSQFVKERMMECSDMDVFHICDDCGQFVSKVPNKTYYQCQPCNNFTRISKVSMPYACKLLFQELKSVNLVPRIDVDTTKFD